VQLARVLKKTGSFHYDLDWQVSHHVEGMLSQIVEGMNSKVTPAVPDRRLVATLGANPREQHDIA
jgi:hypothetical protein